MLSFKCSILLLCVLCKCGLCAEETLTLELRDKAEPASKEATSEWAADESSDLEDGGDGDFVEENAMNPKVVAHDASMHTEDENGIYGDFMNQKAFEVEDTKELPEEENEVSEDDYVEDGDVPNQRALEVKDETELDEDAGDFAVTEVTWRLINSTYIGLNT